MASTLPGYQNQTSKSLTNFARCLIRMFEMHQKSERADSLIRNRFVIRWYRFGTKLRKRPQEKDKSKKRCKFGSEFQVGLFIDKRLQSQTTNCKHQTYHQEFTL